jgi:hypothetical protein
MDLVSLNLDGTPRSVRSDLWRVWLQPGPPEPEVQVQIQADPNARLNWSELSKLKELVELHYTGGDAGVVEYLASRPAIRTFEWRDHRQARVDLSRLQLRQVWLELPEGDFELILPASASLRQLSLSASRPGQRVRIVTEDRGRGVALRLLCRESKEPRNGIEGLEAARSLHFWSVNTLRLSSFAGFANLEELLVFGPPGKIEDIENLAQFPGLKKLQLRECYSLNAEAIPEPARLPHLKAVEIDGIRESDAAVLSQRLAGGPKLSIRGRRSDTWLKANIDNPFRHWEDEYPKKVATAATLAYRKALAAVDKLPPEASTEAAWVVMETFMAAFNRVNEKHDLDTIMREEVGDVFYELVERLPASVDRALAQGWFDELRDF